MLGNPSGPSSLGHRPSQKVEILIYGRKQPLQTGVAQVYKGRQGGRIPDRLRQSVKGIPGEEAVALDLRHRQLRFTAKAPDCSSCKGMLVKTVSATSHLAPAHPAAQCLDVAVPIRKV